MSRKKLREDNKEAGIATTVPEEGLVGRTAGMKGNALLSRPMTAVVVAETVRVERSVLDVVDVVDDVVATNPSKVASRMRT